MWSDQSESLNGRLNDHTTDIRGNLSFALTRTLDLFLVLGGRVLMFVMIKFFMVVLRSDQGLWALPQSFHNSFN